MGEIIVLKKENILVFLLSRPYVNILKTLLILKSQGSKRTMNYWSMWKMGPNLTNFGLVYFEISIF